jgi:hypothetical protein
VPQNQREDGDSLLRLEASRGRVFQSSLKTGEGVARMVHVASSQRLRQVEVEDGRVDSTGYVEPFYSTLSFSMY